VDGRGWHSFRVGEWDELRKSEWYGEEVKCGRLLTAQFPINNLSDLEGYLSKSLSQTRQELQRVLSLVTILTTTISFRYVWRQ